MASEGNGNGEIGRFEAQYRQNPDSLVFARLADAYRKAGDPDRALSVLADGIGRHPDYASAHIVRARCLVDLDRLAEAEASFRRVIELDAQNLVAMQGLAGLAERRGDPVDAVRWYERISALDPMNVEAEAALARLRPASAPTSTGLEQLPAPREEWWSSPAFQIDAEDEAAGDGDDAEAEPDIRAEETEDFAAEDAFEIATGAADAMAASEGPDRGEDDERDTGTAWWFEDPGDDDPADDGDLLTRTMAELYVQQGLLEEAAAIYRELLTDRPDDEGLRRALDDLEARTDGPDDEADGGGTSNDHVEVEDDVGAVASDVDEGADAVGGKAPEVPPAGSAEAADAGIASSAVADAADAPPIPAPTDPFATHPSPGPAGTGQVFRDWLQRLSR